MKRIHAPRRSGLTMGEVLVAASLVIAMIGLVTPLTFRVGRIWSETRCQQIALQELANQLELFATLDGNRATELLERLAPSELARQTLPGLELKGTVVRDEDGPYVELQLTWDRPANARPLKLVRWLNASSPNENNEQGERP